MWGPVVTLKACYVVCRFASAQLLLSVLRTLVCAWLFTRSLPGWKRLVENNMPAPAGCNCAHAYALAIKKKKKSPNTLWRRLMLKDLSIVKAWLITVTLLHVWHSDPVVTASPTCLFFKCSKWFIQHHLADEKTDRMDDLQDQTTRPNTQPKSRSDGRVLKITYTCSQSTLGYLPNNWSSGRPYISIQIFAHFSYVLFIFYKSRRLK